MTDHWPNRYSAEEVADMVAAEGVDPDDLPAVLKLGRVKLRSAYLDDLFEQIRRCDDDSLRLLERLEDDELRDLIRMFASSEKLLWQELRDLKGERCAPMTFDDFLRDVEEEAGT